MSTSSDLGSLKLTIQKFYRVNGGSTQMKGVISDIVVPDYLEYLKLREREDPNALPYDEVKKADYKKWQMPFDREAIKRSAAARIANNSIFQNIDQRSRLIAKQNEKNYVLNIDKFKQEQKEMREAMKEIEKLLKLEKAMEISFLRQDEKKYNSEDKDKSERYKQWLNNVSKDIYVDQAVKVIKDIATQQNVAKAVKPI
jgi:carboxyl-terminal processing protease